MEKTKFSELRQLELKVAQLPTICIQEFKAHDSAKPDRQKSLILATSKVI